MIRRVAWVMAWAAWPFGTLELFLPLYARALGADSLLLGWLASIGTAAALVARPLAALLADRGAWRLTASLALGTLISGLGIWAIATNTAMLLIGRALCGAGIASLGLAAQVILSATTKPAERGAAFGRLTAAQALGFALGAVIGGAVIGLWDSATQAEARTLLPAFPWPTPQERTVAFGWVYGIYAGAALVAAFGLWGMQTGQPPQTQPRLLASWRSLWGRKQFRSVLWAGLLLDIAYGFAVPQLIPLLEERFMAGLVGLGIAYAIPGVIYAIGPGLLGTHADRLGHRRAASLGLRISAGVYAGLPFVPGLAWAGLLWCGEAIAYSLFIPALLALLSAEIADHERGAAFSLYTVVSNLGIIVAAPIGGAIYDQGLGWLPFTLAALALLGASIVLAKDPTL